MQDPGTQQVELCSAIHLTLEELQSVDLAFDLAAAPRRLECRPHRRMIRRQADREPSNLASFTVAGAGQPPVEAINVAAVNQAQELTGQAARLRDLRLDGAQGLDELTMLGALWHMVPAFVPADQPSAEGVLSSGDGVKKLASWRKKVAIVPPNQPLIPPNYPEEIIEAVHSALLSEQQLEISYTSREQGETKTYPVHPLGIVQRGAVTYLVATLYDYTDIRLLAVHRIHSAQVLDQPAKTPKKFDLEKYIRLGAFGFEESGEIKLVVRFTTPSVEHLRETPLSLDQQIEPDQPDWVRLRATVPDTAQLRWWLMGFGDQVEILEPVSLRDEFVNMTQSLHRIYHPNN